MQYLLQRKAGRFYPTRLAINLVSGLKEKKLETKRSGFIIVETNYRVYAYTGICLISQSWFCTAQPTACFPDSPIQIALLAIFTEMQYRFPKMVLGSITRESVRQAFKCGITADQIINFLVVHSHPQLHTQNPIVPATVVDQIVLWAKERDRLLYKDGILYSQFNSQPDFDLLRKYANVLIIIIIINPFL